MSTGRHQDAVWHYFIRDNSVPSNIKATLSWMRQGHVDRLKKHAETCHALVEKGLKEVPAKKEDAELGAQLSSSSCATSPLELSQTSAPPTKKARQSFLPLVKTGIIYISLLLPHLFNLAVPPVAWWHAGVRAGFSSSLASLAVRLLSSVGTSGGLERQFSTLRLTYGLLRTKFFFGGFKSVVNWDYFTTS